MTLTVTAENRMKWSKPFFVVLPCLIFSITARAHDPVFAAGPHVIYKGGVELHVGIHQEKSRDERVAEAELRFTVGISGDWAAGISVPYVRSTGQQDTDHARGPTSVSTKYRFWRNDMKGVQESSAIFSKVIFADGDAGQQGRSRRDGNDYLLGFAYGYEGRKWYRFASIRRRFNREAANGVQRPNIWLWDLVVGIRPTPTGYLQPDWVWMLELNGEVTENVTNLVGTSSVRSGGKQLFLSPGLMWTYRNFAVKTGLQLPIRDDLAAGQEPADYRVLLELEWHL